MHLKRRFRELGYKPINGYGFSFASSLGDNSTEPVQHSPKFPGGDARALFGDHAKDSGRARTYFMKDL
jgi:hypothetical protein